MADIPSALIEHVKDGNLILLLGAGVSGGQLIPVPCPRRTVDSLRTRLPQDSSARDLPITLSTKWPPWLSPSPTCTWKLFCSSQFN